MGIKIHASNVGKTMARNENALMGVIESGRRTRWSASGRRPEVHEERHRPALLFN